MLPVAHWTTRYRPEGGGCAAMPHTARHLRILASVPGERAGPPMHPHIAALAHTLGGQ